MPPVSCLSTTGQSIDLPPVELAAAATRSPLAPPARPHDPRAIHTNLNTNLNPSLTLGEIAAASPHNGLHSPQPVDGGRSWAPSFHDRLSHPDPDIHLDDQSPFDNDKRMGVSFLLENNGQARNLDPSLPSPGPPHAITTNSLGSGLGHHAPTLVPHLTLPRNLPTTCPLDAILLDFLTERQQRAAAGDHIKTLVGPQYPNFTPIVYPDRNIDAHPLSKLFTDILRTFPDICGLPEQVAIVYIMFLVMRWQIEPSAENYDRLPDWVTPRASQLFIAHPVWNDHVPW